MDRQTWCPVYHPSKEEFARPFTEYVGEIFRTNPDLPCFKVVPPAGWKARKAAFPPMETVKIATPIRQHVFGKAGAYRCLLVEHKTLSVAEYQKLAEEEAARVTGHKGQAGSACATGVYGHSGPREDSSALLHQKDELSERSFWASVTLNPPLYGADTPVSFFDEKLPYGWNLRNLGDLLTKKGVPEVPGVTTPMTYFGMWRAFFGWHKEDADLLSINYVHFGAPKVWYCVSPKHKDKFERMAACLFPQQAKGCGAFIRHKDILISPSQLRSFDIPYIQAKQQPGEFMVLNAAAYHAGFNMGFNCAEAINFATEDWIAAGKSANRCKCSALKDAVRISMTLFDPSWESSPDPSDAEESDGDDEGADDEGACEAEKALLAKMQRNKDRLQALLRHSMQGGCGSAPRTQSLPAPDAKADSGRDSGGQAGSGSVGANRMGSAPVLSAAAQALIQAYGRLNGRSLKRPRSTDDGADEEIPSEPELEPELAPAPAAKAASKVPKAPASGKAQAAARPPPVPTVPKAPPPAAGNMPVKQEAPAEARATSVSQPQSRPPANAPVPAAAKAPATAKAHVPAAGKAPAATKGSMPSKVAAVPQGEKVIEVMELMSSDDEGGNGAAREAKAGVASQGKAGSVSKVAANAIQAAELGLARATSAPGAFRGLPGSRPTQRRKPVDAIPQPTPRPVPAPLPNPTRRSQSPVPTMQKIVYRWGGGVHNLPPPARAIVPGYQQPTSYFVEPLPQPRKASRLQPEQLQQQQQPAMRMPIPQGPSPVMQRSQSPGLRRNSPIPVRAPSIPRRESPRRPSPSPRLSDVALELLREPVQGPPHAVVWEDEGGQRHFHLVQQLQRASRSGQGHVLLRLLREENDGLYYPSSDIWEELSSTLVEVRTHMVTDGTMLVAGTVGKDVPGYRLLTHESRILDTELVG